MRLASYLDRTMTYITRGIGSIFYAMCYPSLIKHAASLVYREGSAKRDGVLRKNLNELTNIDQQIRLQNCIPRSGNIDPLELIAICLLIRKKNPSNLLEIGTFDGNTTLQMALNSKEDAIIRTLDLSDDTNLNDLKSEYEEVPYILDVRKRHRRYLDFPERLKVVQHFGNSLEYDFHRFGPIDFCFIDGGHSYTCVKTDTEKVLDILAPNGMIVWHDFCASWPGVYRYLREFAKTQPLIAIEGTRLAVYSAST